MVQLPSPRLVLALSCACALVALIPDLDTGFSGWDDKAWVADCEERDSLGEIMDPNFPTSNGLRATYYVPAQNLVFEAAVGLGDRWGPMALRALLILCHLLNGLLLFRLFEALLVPLRSGAPAELPGLRSSIALGAGLFLVYPANVEAARWISAGVSHVIPVTLMLCTCLVWLRFCPLRRSAAGVRWWLLSVALTGVICLFKETAVLAPLWFLFIGLANELAKGDKRARRISFELFPWLVPSLLLAAGVVAMQYHLYPGGSIAGEWGGIRLLRSPVRLMELLTQLPLPAHQPARLKTTLMVVATLGLALLALRALRYKRIAGLVFLGLLHLVPFSVSNFAPLDGLTRYLYLPSAALFVGLAFIPPDVGAFHAAPRFTRLGNGILVGCLALFAVASLIMGWY